MSEDDGVNGLTKRAMEGEIMNRVGSYDSYVNNYRSYETVSQSGTQRAASTREAANTKPVELSRGAKNLLKELQQKYGNMDFIVGDFESEEEAASYLDRGTKDYSVLMSVEELEEMAKDSSSKKEGMNKIESARNQLAYLQTQLDESGENVKKLGVVFEKDGTTTLFASMEKVSEQQRERQEEAKRAEKSTADSTYKRAKRTTVKAATTEELLKKIRSVDWNSVEEKLVPSSGSKFDYFG